MATRVVIQNSSNIHSENEQVSPLYITLISLVNSLTNLSLGGATLCALQYIFSSYYMPTSIKQHVYLCVFGYLILMTQAIQSLNPHAGWGRLLSSRNRRMIHWTLQIIGTIMVSCGTIIIMSDTRINLATTHGVLGFLAFMCTLLSMAAGIINANAGRIRFNINTNIMKLVHSSLGGLTLCMAFVSLCIAFNRESTSYAEDKAAGVAITLTVFGLVGTLLSPCLEVIRRVNK